MRFFGPANMRMRLKYRGSARVKAAYRMKPAAFLASVLVHAAIITLLLLGGSELAPPVSQTPIYDKEIRPYRDKIVWYRFKKDLPEVSSGTSQKPVAARKSKTVMIARPDSLRAKQFIQNTASPQRIKRDIPSPNIVAVSVAPEPAPPPRQFVPPAVKRQAQPAAEKTIEQVAVPDWNLTMSALAANSRLLPTQRAFIPPPKQTPKLPMPVQVEAVDGLLARSSAANVSAMANSEVLKPVAGVPGPPAPAAVEAKSGVSAADRNGTGGVNTVIVGLNPADKFSGPIPNGRRSPDVSMGPNTGAEAGGGNGIAVAGLTSRGNPGATAPHIDSPPDARLGPKKQVLYSDLLSGPMPSSFSAPLYPSSRRIRADLEVRFQNRTVYALAIPSPNLPQYAGAWTIWYAERSTTPAEVARMRPPLPYRKAELAAAASVPVAMREVPVQVAVVIDESGKVQALEILKGASGAAAKAVLGDIAAWEFKPATKNAKPISVEVVFEIPFRLNAELAAQ